MEAVLQERDESEVHRSLPRQLFSVPTIEQSGLAHQICVHSDCSCDKKSIAFFLMI